MESYINFFKPDRITPDIFLFKLITSLDIKNSERLNIPFFKFKNGKLNLIHPNGHSYYSKFTKLPGEP